MNNERPAPIFPQGINFKAPGEQAPSFVKGSLNIKVDEFITWLNQQNKVWVNIDLKEAKSGKYYLALNTWEPKKVREEMADHSPAPDTQAVPF